MSHSDTYTVISYLIYTHRKRVIMFKIVSSLLAHDGGPVRSLSNGPVGEIVSGCQSDNPNSRRFLLSGDNLEEIGSPSYHDHWVVALTSLTADLTRLVYPEVCLIMLSWPCESRQQQCLGSHDF